MPSGGKRANAGRKSKKEEDKLQDYLSLYEDEVLEQLMKGVRKGEFKFIQLYMNYRYGRPKESKDITSGGKEINIVSLGSGEES